MLLVYVIHKAKPIERFGFYIKIIDNLNYSHNPNSNKILKVDDTSSETVSFRDVTGNDYDYWLDGNLKKDANKDITQIDYNYLKLSKQITLTGGRWIRYEYDVSGTKLKKTLSTDKVIDYEEDEIYEDGVLYQTSHDEGRIVDGIYEYNINDHLGNTRVSFRDFGGVAQATQVNHVGAWGESLESLNVINTPKINNFTLSTYEKENDFGIGVFDAHARVFDPVTPRFWSIDPLSELSRRFSPFTYGNNNPVLMIDPDGMKSINSIQKAWDDTAEGSSSSWTNDGSGGFSNDPPTAANVNTSDRYDKFGTGTNITSGIYSGTKLAEVVVKGKKYNAFDESIRVYGTGSYNKRYYPRNLNDHNDYSPYNSDAVGFSYRFGGNSGVPSGGYEAGLIISNGELAFFGSPVFGGGLSYPGKGGFSFNIYDRYGGETDVFAGIVDQSAGIEVNLVFGGGFARSSQIVNNQVQWATRGTQTISIGLIPSVTNIGISGTISNTTLWRPFRK